MAGLIPRDFIDTLLTRVDIVDVIDGRVPLVKKGRDFMACCPFHDEKTPSFSVSQPKQFFYCFGCQERGNAIDFLMKHENRPFPEAVEELARRDRRAGRDGRQGQLVLSETAQEPPRA